MKKTHDAHTQFLAAIEGFKDELVEAPEYQHETYKRLGDTYASIGDFKNASEAFKNALALNPSDPINYTNLEKSLEFQGRYEEAIEVLQQQLKFFKNRMGPQDVEQLRKYIEYLEYRKSLPTK